MDYEREKGRIASLEKRRRETAVWAATLIPLLDQARSEASVGARGELTNEGYADWLNAHSVPARRGGEWFKTSVARLWDVGRSMKDQAYSLLQAERAMHRYQPYATAESRQRSSERLKAAETKYLEVLKDADKLHAQLRGAKTRTREREAP